MRSELAQPLRLAVVYVLFSSVWILLSDQLLAALVFDSAAMTQMQTIKGLSFVLLSSSLIYYLSFRDHKAQRQLLNSLRRHARQMQQAQRNAALGNWEYDGRFHWSEEALHVLDQAPGSHPSSLEHLLGWLHPADRPALLSAVQPLREGSGALAINVRLNRPGDIDTTWLMLRGEPDSPGHAIGTVQDISAHKRDEEALRESEQRFRQLFEKTPRIAVQGYNRERRVIFWNQASVQLYGYSVAEAMGRRLEDLIIPPEAREQVIGEIDRWLAGGAPIPASELQLQNKSGQRIWIYSSHLMLCNTHDELELYCVDIDLSEQKRANAAMEASEARYRNLVEQLNEAIFLTDADGCLSFLNPAWQSLSGYRASEALGKPLQSFLLSDDEQRIAGVMLLILYGQCASWTGDCRLRSASGRTRWVRLQLRREESVLGVRGSLADIHAERQTLELQQARNAVLDELLGLQPLTLILRGIAERLELLNPEMQVAIMLLDPAQGCLRLLAAPSLPASFSQAIDRQKPALQLTSSAQAVISGELVIAPHLQQSPHWLAFRELAASAGIQACWSLPFKDDGGRVLGTFDLYYPLPNTPSEDDIALVTEFTRLAGLAVQQQHRETERQESEQRFRATFEHAAVGMAHVAPDGRWLRVNSLLCQILGYSREELLRLSFQDITHPDDLTRDLDQLRQLLAGEISRYSLEKRYRRGDGRVLWANLSVALVSHADGTPFYFISVVEDISLRKQQELALHQAATVFDSTHEAVAIVDGGRRILASNPAFSAITGLSREQAIGQRVPLHLGSSVERIRYRELWHAALEQGHWQGELSSRRQDGTVFPLWLTASLVRDCDPLQPQFVLVFTDLSQFKDSQERMAHLAHFDPLTDLPNRLYARERLNHALEHGQRHRERVAVMFLDLDHFKTINDSLGHAVGDELLVEVAHRLQQRLRNEDTLARLGGDEFLVILENLQHPDEAAHIAQVLLELFERPLPLSEHEVYLTLSIGISLYPDDGQNGDELIRNADAALYQAKAEGRNCSRFYTQALTERAHSRLILEHQLREALQRDEFVLHFQPLVDVVSGETHGAEALLRWQSAQGMIAPADFIPLAEETGLIVPIGAWVLREACRQAQAWRAQGLPLECLAVNLSPRQFKQADLIDQVRHALETSGLPAACLELEITEGALMEDVEQAQTTLAGLRQLGVHLAVDDFGTGYSSLAYLQRFPLGKLKIDQSFMRGMPEDHGNLEIIGTLVALARSLDLSILAEGVETQAQLDVLRQLGCEQCQGYLFSRPLSAELFGAWLRDDRQSVG